MSAVVLVTTVGAWTAYQYFGAQIHRIRLGLGDDRPADAASGTRNYLLVGSDSRAGTGNEYQRGGAVTDERSDTTILAHLDVDGTTTMVSFPRDTLVRIPGHGRGKLNSAITLGGPSLLIRTLENLTDIRIDHYVSIDLAGFKAMTDALGGVTVCVKALPGGSRANLYDPWSQWHGHVGANRLSGEQALAFVRQRHGLPDNDFDRIRRQQQFIGAVFAQATSTGVLTNPVKLESLLHAATGALTVDDGTGINDLRALATRLRGLSSDQIRFETIPVHTPTPAEGANAIGELPRFGAVQLYDPLALEKFLGPLRGRPGRDATGPASASPGSGSAAAATGAAGLVPAGQIAIDVYNAAGVSGLAAAASSKLTRAGFQVGPVQDWSGGKLARTQIRYRPGDSGTPDTPGTASSSSAPGTSGGRAAAATVQAAIPGSRTRADPDVPAGRISVVLGADFDPTAIATAAAASAGTGGSGPVTASPHPDTSGITDNSQPPTTASALTADCTY
ncbi:LCP family protein [Frankia sp. R82]|uniref:LCP family protein n=1 Tax=Frankia sp. R82 TaxID=2950553 RepID=UPI00204401E8|nr:LCP family protein [Frankia sp. R82]MCM3884515.1 LCP family protein [Frankia sp. R82]